ncbi:triose-phosphate transporter family-domain-containing protein [Cladochytrium replicatum]|nr:triose-phosphate transporter family-domain-containing protein [Cladochytrium replicatum]
MLSSPESEGPLATTANLIYILLNIVSSVGIVISNKWVIETHNFRFGTLLTFFHFVMTSVGLELCARFGLYQRKRIPWSQVVALSASFCGFVVLTNLSLQYNSIAFYQMAKVLTTPTIVVIQSLYYGVQFSNLIKASLFVTCFGVLVTSVTDVKVNFIGTLCAISGVIVTSLYQIWVGTRQKELGANSMQLLAYQAPLSAFMLLFVIPLIDDMKGLRSYQFTVENITWIFISSFLAFFVNISIFLIIGKTSPVTYNVVGHFKLSTIIILGFVIFGSPVDFKNILGILISCGGVFWYTHLKMKESG